MDRQQGLPNMTNQLTAYGRIGAKNERNRKTNQMGRAN